MGAFWLSRRVDAGCRKAGGVMGRLIENLLSVSDFVELVKEFSEAWFGSQKIDPIEEQILYYETIISSAENQIESLRQSKIDRLKSMKYTDYLETHHWKTVRKMMLDHAGHRCQLCNACDRSLHVHHRTYENRGRETQSDLIVLCADCHGQFHEKLELSK